MSCMSFSDMSVDRANPQGMSYIVFKRFDPT